MKDVGIFYGHLVHYTVFSYILWTFGIVHVNLDIFSGFGIFYKEINLATLLLPRRGTVAARQDNCKLNFCCFFK
jgi:hypothetical protein